MIKLIIFDLDGTLVDSSIDITNALNFALEPYGFGKMTVAQTVGMVGEGLTRLLEKVIGQQKAPLLPEVIDRFIRYYSDHMADFTVPYRGVKETLELLGDYRKAVISNKRESLSKKLLLELGLAGFFDTILGSDSVDEKKPSPKPIMAVLELFSLAPPEAVIVGDSSYDMDSGRGAGVRTIAVSYGFRDAASLRGADFIIDDIRDLIATLSDLNAAPSR